MPVSALIAAAELFEIAENSLRVAVARLLTAGQIERDERGRYRLGVAAQPVDRQVRSWRNLEEQVRDWDGRWIAIHLGELETPRRAALGRRERALRLLGFAMLSDGLALRPDNLNRPLETLRLEASALGLETGALLFRIDALDPANDARARGLWDVASLCEGYARSEQDLGASLAGLGDLSEGDAMVESYLLGGRILRQLVLDPLLPEPIAPVAGRRRLVAAMRRYDEAGRRAWAAFLARHGAPHSTLPTDGGADPVALH